MGTPYDMNLVGKGDYGGRGYKDYLINTLLEYPVNLVFFVV